MGWYLHIHMDSCGVTAAKLRYRSRKVWIFFIDYKIVVEIARLICYTRRAWRVKLEKNELTELGNFFL